MTLTTPPAAQQVFRVDPSSLSVGDRCLVIDGADDNANHSIHLMFIESGETGVERFQFPEGELVAINGVLESSHKDAIVKEVYDQHTITLLVSDADDKIRFGSGYPPEAGDPNFVIDKSA